jgi:hypothetical protein
MDDIKIDIGEVGWGGVDWIGLAQDTDMWRALVNVVMNLLGKNRVASQLVTSLCSIELVS